LKLYTAAWLPRLPEVLRFIAAQLAPARVVLRLSRNIQELADREFGRRDGTVVHGQPLEGAVVFRETGLCFEADTLRGQKTGFFLDQRESRRRIESLARGRDVLNAFSFSGGFSLYAARGGAKSVTDIDLSAHALAAARRNFALNAQVPAVAACRHDIVQADAFAWLKRDPMRHYGLVILDPPSLAKRESERSGAVGAYANLVAASLRQVDHGGVLLACSCSAHVSADEFFGTVQATVKASGRPFQVLQTTRQPPDHPATFAEGEYLKAIYLQL
jgi:23S rRNA (cytosine1962-C5)-methyltransferase